MKEIDMLKQMLEMCAAEAQNQRGRGKPASKEERDEFVLDRPFESD
jgi:hypothetical protein